MSYLIVDSGTACPYGSHGVDTLSGCSVAASALGLFDTTAVNVNPTSFNDEPPNCYLTVSGLYFSSNGLNIGSCTPSRNCICRVGT